MLGPIFAEFALRLRSLSAMLLGPEDSILLFCARGGLRMQLAYERFLAATALPSPGPIAPLMVSRVVAVRGAVLRAIDEGRSELLPAAATAMRYEFAGSTVGQVAAAFSDTPIDAGRGSEGVSSRGLITFLRSDEGGAALAALREQESLFTRHLDTQRAGRSRVILVDTGLFGTTRELLAEGHQELDVGSALIARSFRPGYPRPGRSRGLLLEADSYAPGRPRTAMLRHWHFVEYLFEPALESVTRFADVAGTVTSNLEVADWAASLRPGPGSAFAGILDYLDALGPAPAAQIVSDAAVAWRQLYRSLVFPTRVDSEAFAVGTRSHGFGRRETWSEEGWRGPRAALRADATWREGDIAQSGGAWRVPLLTGVEAAYQVRFAFRSVRAALR